MPDDYALQQSVRDQQYVEACAKHGIAPMVDGESHALEYDSNRSEASYFQDLAEILDSEIDRLIEEYGTEHRPAIEAAMACVRQRAERIADESGMRKIIRVLMWMLNSASGNHKARVHQLMHAIPGMAVMCGFQSMRASARECGVSAEWMSRGRAEACAVLEVTIPADSTKSEEAKEKYSAAGKSNHWRHQRFTTSTTSPHEPTKKTPQRNPVGVPHCSPARIEAQDSPVGERVSD